MHKELDAWKIQESIPGKSLWRGPQLELFPLKLTAVIEWPGAKTADAWGTVVASDGDTFIVKTDKDGLRSRVSEFLYANLLRAINFATPDTAIIEMSSGELYSGSRFLKGVAADAETASILTSKPQSETQYPVEQSG